MPMVEHLTPPERETTITTTDADDVVRIWTCRRRHIGELKRNKAFRLVKEGMYGDTPWAEFVIEEARWSPASGAKRTLNLTEDQRRERGERLRRGREAS